MSNWIHLTAGSEIDSYGLCIQSHNPFMISFRTGRIGVSKNWTGKISKHFSKIPSPYSIKKKWNSLTH